VITALRVTRSKQSDRSGALVDKDKPALALPEAVAVRSSLEDGNLACKRVAISEYRLRSSSVSESGVTPP
jgi:hypothetical protein